uniref:Uncharacterized protein n=1 Tax=Arundo donax TaxID=35708 RepID=A0A0A9FSQ3_ARUDO
MLLSLDAYHWCAVTTVSIGLWGLFYISGWFRIWNLELQDCLVLGFYFVAAADELASER